MFNLGHRRNLVSEVEEKTSFWASSDDTCYILYIVRQSMSSSFNGFFNGIPNLDCPIICRGINKLC